jgi:hypothetical protein
MRIVASDEEIVIPNQRISLSLPRPPKVETVTLPLSYAMALSAAVDAYDALIEGPLTENVIRDARAASKELDRLEQQLSQEIRKALNLWE